MPYQGVSRLSGSNRLAYGYRVKPDSLKNGLAILKNDFRRSLT